MEKNHPISELMSTTMQKIREMVDVNTIVGTPIHTDDGVTLIPVSRLSFGFASGGSDFAAKNQKPDADNSFGGGSGAGVNIAPVAFLIVKGDSVKLLPVAPPAGSAVDRAVELVPEMFDKITGYLEKNKKEELACLLYLSQVNSFQSRFLLRKSNCNESLHKTFLLSPLSP